MTRSFRTLGTVLLVYWLVASLLAFTLTSAQPDQLGVFEAFIYQRLAADPAWLLVVGIALVSARARTTRVLVGGVGVGMGVAWTAFLLAGIAMGQTFGRWPGYEPFRPVIAQFYESVVRQPMWILPVSVGLIIAAAVYDGP
jgi:hypothetical protein